MDLTSCRAMCAEFDRALLAVGWTQAKRTDTSTFYERGRCRLAIGAQASGEVSWSVFPTNPPAEKYPGVVFTRPSAIPLVMCTIDEVSGVFHVSTHGLDRSGRMVREPFFSGDMATAFARLCEESDRRVEQFVRLVETPPAH